MTGRTPGTASGCHGRVDGGTDPRTIGGTVTSGGEIGLSPVCGQQPGKTPGCWFLHVSVVGFDRQPEREWEWCRQKVGGVRHQIF